MANYWPWPITVGNDDLFIFPTRDSLGVPLDLTGVQARLAIAWPGGSALFASGRDAEITIPDQTGDMRGEVHVRLTTAFTRTLPAGRVAKYELELRGLLIAGQEGNALEGPLDVSGGINPDGVVA
jgi:hypothetical protein